MNAPTALTFLPQTSHSNGDGHDPIAVHLFNRTYRNPQTNTLRRLIGRQSQPLRLLQDVEAEQSLSNRHYVGIRSIPLDSIHGTINRVDDFDDEFHPLKESDKNRWCGVATAMMDGRDLGPIEVVQVGDVYFVKDGHHRISVARAMEFLYLDAIVERWSEK